MADKKIKLEEDNYIRHKLFSGNETSLKRYARLVIGEYSIVKLIKYEVITSLFGLIPGALGILLRKFFYPSLFNHCGKGVVFGRGIVVRNAHKINLCDKVMIDDDCLLDARGGDGIGIDIGKEVILNRRVSVQCKIGEIRIGANSDVGADSSIVAQGNTLIGDMVTIGGGAKIGGGSIELSPTHEEKEQDATNDFSSRGHERFTRGAVVIGDKCVFGRSVIVMDGVSVGNGTVVGTGTILRESVPAESIVTTHVKQIIMPRGHIGKKQVNVHEQKVTTRKSVAEESSSDFDTVLRLVYNAIRELNTQLPADRKIFERKNSPLIEPDGVLDSMGIINLIMVTEQVVEEELGCVIDLAEFRQELGIANPFSSVEQFCCYVLRVIND